MALLDSWCERGLYMEYHETVNIQKTALSARRFVVQGPNKTLIIACFEIPVAGM